MSGSHKLPSRYDKYIPLFHCTSNNEQVDKRVRLFLDELHDQSKMLLASINGINFTKEVVGLAHITSRMCIDFFNSRHEEDYVTSAPESGYNGYNGYNGSDSKRTGSIIRASVRDPGAVRRSITRERSPLLHGGAHPFDVNAGKLHSQWMRFFDNINTLMTRESTCSEQQLNVVRMLAAEAPSGCLEQLMQVVVMKVCNVYMGDRDITHEPNLWGSATQLKLRGLGEVIGENVYVLGPRATAYNLARYGREDKEYFSLNLTKYVKHHLEESANLPISLQPSKFFEDLEVKNVYYRKVDGHLYTKDENGERRVDQGSQDFANLTVPNKCLSTGVKADSDGTCAEYLTKCLSGQDMQKCKEYFQQDKFYDIADDEVNKMNPTMMLRTIRAFQFPIVSQVCERTGHNVEKPGTVNQWLKKVKGTVSSAEFEKISKNTKLLNYLEMIVHKLKMNPGVLNKNYVQNGAQQYNPNAFEGTRLYKYGLRPDLPVDPLSPALVDRLGNMIQRYNNRLGLVFGLRNYVLLGAGMIEDIQEQHVVQQQVAGKFRNMYIAFQERLKRLGKKLDQSDDVNIQRLISKLESAEKSLGKTMVYAEKYSNLLELHDEYDANDVLNMDTLKKFVQSRNHYFNKTTQRQGSLLSILKTLAESVQSGTNHKEVNKDFGNLL